MVRKKTSGDDSEEKPPKQKGTHGGNHKAVAPEGFYTAAQAAEKLKIPLSTFYYYKREGIIERTVPGIRKNLPKGNGYYSKEQIDSMVDSEVIPQVLSAEEQQDYATKKRELPVYNTEVRLAEDADAEGVVLILKMLKWPAATARQRRSWYRINPAIDLIVTAVVDERELALGYGKGSAAKLLAAGRDGRVVAGYITAVPYREDILADMMAGRKRAKNIRPEHINPHQRGKQDIYVGIAILKELRHSPVFGFRLLAGFLFLLQELATEGIFVRRLYAVSAEDDGQLLCKKLGFELQPGEEGDAFPRYMLDLDTSDAHFAQMYRQGVAEFWEQQGS